VTVTVQFILLSYKTDIRTSGHQEISFLIKHFLLFLVVTRMTRFRLKKFRWRNGFKSEGNKTTFRTIFDNNWVKRVTVSDRGSKWGQDVKCLVLSVSFSRFSLLQCKRTRMNRRERWHMRFGHFASGVFPCRTSDTKQCLWYSCFGTFKTVSWMHVRGCEEQDGVRKRLLVRGHHLLIFSLILLDRKTRDWETRTNDKTRKNYCKENNKIHDLKRKDPQKQENVPQKGWHACTTGDEKSSH